MDGDRDDLPAAAARLRRAADVLAQEDDAELRAVADGIMAYLAGNAPTLDIALDVQPGPGQRSAATTIRITERNGLIRRAAEQFFPDRKPARRARELSTAINRFATSSWPRERHLVSCPDRHSGTVQAFAWEILCLDDHPLSAERIRKILVTSSGCL